LHRRPVRIARAAARVVIMGKYPPAKPGALVREPLEAAGRVADATPLAVASSRSNFPIRISIPAEVSNWSTWERTHYMVIAL
jgi:hypothetical protein